MRSITETVTLAAPPRRAFEFISDPANLPRWAVEFCRAIRRDGRRWIVRTPQGEAEIRYEPDPKSGIIDMVVVPAPGIESTARARVVPNGDGAEFIFTFFQAPGTPDAAFEGMARSLRKELDVLRSLLS